MKVSWEKVHTILGQADYKQCSASKSHQEPIDHPYYHLFSGNERTPWVLLAFFPISTKEITLI